MLGIGLVNPKCCHNIGSVLRLAYNFEADIVVTSGKRYSPNAPTNTPKGHYHVPYLRSENIFDSIPHSSIPIAVEITENAVDISHFHHPKNAFYIFGPEDGSINKEIVEKCKYVVKIPTKNCMNLANTVAVVLYDRLSKGTV